MARKSLVLIELFSTICHDFWRKSGRFSTWKTAMAHPTRTHGPVRTLVLSATFLGVSLLSGCYSEGGLPWSEDQHVFVSRPYQPWTVSLKDTRTGEEFWSVEVPVGKQLVVHFVSGAGAKGSYAGDQMEWGLFKEGEIYGTLGNTIPVPPPNARRLETTLRPVPEASPDMATNAGSTPPPNGSGTENP